MECGLINELVSLHWRHNGRDGVSNNQPCLLNRLFRHRSKKTSKLHVTGLSGEFPAQMTSNVDNVSFDDVIMWEACVQ